MRLITAAALVLFAVPAPAAPASATKVATQPAQRAGFLIDAPGEPNNVKTYEGRVVWKQSKTDVRAEIELPGAKLNISILMRRNLDPQVPASIMVSLRFLPVAGNTLGSVKQINIPRMRNEEAQTGQALAGLVLTTADDNFLFGLTQGDVQRPNIELIESRNWMDIPILMTSGKLAKLTFEKGTMGQRIVLDALRRWSLKP